MTSIRTTLYYSLATHVLARHEALSVRMVEGMKFQAYYLTLSAAPALYSVSLTV
jgi:hypothetical protein